MRHRTVALMVAVGGMWLCAAAGVAHAEDQGKGKDEVKAQTDSTSAKTFPGWQGMRAIRVDGAPTQLIAADLDGDGREALIQVDARQSRLLIYRWVNRENRQDAPALDPERPNELPMAPEIRREEIPIEDLPRAVAAVQLDEDEPGKQLLVLTSPPLRLSVMQRQEVEGEGKRWRRTRSWDIEDGNIGDSLRLLVRRTPAHHQAILSMEDGILLLDLVEDATPQWLSPRERRGRADLWLADVDGDGLEDLVEWVRGSNAAIRWFRNTGERFAPPVNIYDQSTQQAALLTRAKGDVTAGQVLLMPSVPRGSLRRYGLGSDEHNVAGRRDALPVPGAGSETWCGIELGDRKALAHVDPRQPRLLVHALGEDGWEGEESYPIVNNVRAIAAPPARPGKLLLWTRDAGHLHASRWEAGRLTYPRPWRLVESEDEKKIITLRQTGSTVWWAQKVGSDLLLWVWEPGADEPVKTRFTGLGDVENLTWLGENNLLVMERFARNAKLAVLDEEGNVRTSEPGHLRAAGFDEFVLFGHGEGRRLGRLTDGVLQWMDDELQPEDQIMLPEGRRLVSFIPDGDEAWALERGGGRMFRLKPDEAGILRPAQGVKLPGGSRLEANPVLGMLLIGGETVTRLLPGEPFNLELIQAVDTTERRQTSLDEFTPVRFFTTDVTGDGVDDVLLVDDERNRITLLTLVDDALESQFSWQVFEAGKYPYAGDRDFYGPRRGRANEPRFLLGLDLDGSGQRDLVILSHDRLLIYLGRDEETKP